MLNIVPDYYQFLEIVNFFFEIYEDMLNFFMSYNIFSKYPGFLFSLFINVYVFVLFGFCIWPSFHPHRTKYPFGLYK